MKRVAIGALHLAAAATIIVLAGLVSGHLGIFFDTGGYVRQGEYMADRFLGIARIGHYPMMSIVPGQVGTDVRHFLSVIDARSPFYSLFLYLGAKIGHLAFVAWLQALAAAWVVALATRLVLPERRWTAFWAVIAVLAVGTSLPFFADFAMPDVFSGIAILCIALLLAGARDLSWLERFGVWLLMAASISFHKSNLGVAALLVVAGVLAALVAGLPRKNVLLGGASVVAALVVVVGLGALYKSALERDVGLRTGSPPFFMARVLADGPGRDYLRKNCPGGAAPSLCRFRDQALDNANVILWNLEPGIGVYSASKYEGRLELQDQQTRFVIAAVAAEPFRWARVALGHGLQQLSMVAVDDPLETPGRYITGEYPDTATVNLLLPGIKACATFESCPPGAITTILKVWHIAVLVASLFVLSWAILHIWRCHADRGRYRNRLATAAAGTTIILLGIVLNAAVCGILSDPVARYQSRLIWLLPMAAVLAAFLSRVLVDARQSRRPASEPHSLAATGA